MKNGDPMPARTLTFQVLFLGALAFIMGVLSPSARAQSAPSVRAKAPAFGGSSGTFFEDVFRDGLTGQRPSDLGAPKKPQPAGGSSGNGSNAGAGGGWEKFVSATTLENEVKALKKEVDGSISTPTDFKSRGARKVRQHFALLASTFGIIGEYSGDVRWKRFAHDARETFAQSSKNAKTVSDGSYKEAKLRKEDLQTLLSGGSFSSTKKGEAEFEWDKVVLRSQVMRRIELAQKDRLKPMTSSEAEFKKNKDAIIHEAEMLAAMTEILTKDEMENGDDGDYEAFCRSMQKACDEIKTAVTDGDVAKASSALGDIMQACDDCHGDYR